MKAAIPGVSASWRDVVARLDVLLEPYYLEGYAVMRATVPLLHFCMQHLRTGDEFSRKLRAFFLQAIENERGHDELLLGDMGRLGISRDVAERWFPSSAVTAVVGNQYFWVSQFHPAVHLGYIALLECFPPTNESVNAMIAASGGPPEAFTTIKLHAELDVDHRQQLIRIMNAVPAGDYSLQRAIIANGLRSAELFCQANEWLVNYSEQRSSAPVHGEFVRS
jgi:hypothetical protein